MNIKIFRHMGIIVVICLCVVAVIGKKQARAISETEQIPANVDIQEIQAVWEKFLTGYADSNIDAMMEMVSPNYLKTFNDTTIDYNGLRSIMTKTNTDFFNNYLRFSVYEVKILNSDITDNRAVVDFQYQLDVFDKGLMQWVSLVMAQKITFARENGQWKIITIGDRKRLY
jgi:hypothetical protein